jgi:hypothetical protein
MAFGDLWAVRRPGGFEERGDGRVERDVGAR